MGRHKINIIYYKRPSWKIFMRKTMCIYIYIFPFYSTIDRNNHDYNYPVLLLP